MTTAHQSPRLWIAEKPDVAKLIVAALCRVTGARVLNTATVQRDGYHHLSSGEKVSYVFGHMLEKAKPREYLTDEQRVGNQFLFLPMFPQKFKVTVKLELDKSGAPRLKDGVPVTSYQFDKLTELIRTSKRIVNACDIDREGQLIFDEIMIKLGLNPSGAPGLEIQRADIASNTDADMNISVTRLENNGDRRWVLLRMAALVRDAMDWLWGMNLSMAMQELLKNYTKPIAQQVPGGKSKSTPTSIKIAIGRVQSPVLSLVVDRDSKIAAFVKTDYFIPSVTLSNGVELDWEKRDGAKGTAGFDSHGDHGRIIVAATAQQIATAISNGLPGKITVSNGVEMSEGPPLPFSMGTLLTTVSKKYGLSVAAVSAAAKSLYEQHKVITYIGTDCQYLPNTMHADAAGTIAKLSSMFGASTAGANPTLKSKAFNDGKVEEHFAIVPNGALPGHLSPDESIVYGAIVNRYLAQFYPPYRFMKTSLVVMFGRDEFRASANDCISLGWKEVELDKQQMASGPTDPAVAASKADQMTSLAEGQSVKAIATKVKPMRTKPPAHYTVATLLEDMLNASKFSDNPEVRAALKESKGIGTSRTREAIILGLIKKGLLCLQVEKKNEWLLSTQTGMELINQVAEISPEIIDVAMTAQWELIFGAIAKGDVEAEKVLIGMSQNIVVLVERMRRRAAAPANPDFNPATLAEIGQLIH